MSSMTMNLGTLAGIQVMFVLLGDSRTPEAFSRAFLVGGAVAAIGVVGALIMSRQQPAARVNPVPVEAPA
jgi:hypothetical protein